MSATLRRAAVLGLCALLLLAATGCVGPFAVTSSVHDWNLEVSDSRWVREGVFLLLVIVPVYELCLLGDALIFNSIEFWTGDDLVGASPPLLPEAPPAATG